MPKRNCLQALFNLRRCNIALRFRDRNAFRIQGISGNVRFISVSGRHELNVHFGLSPEEARKQKDRLGVVFCKIRSGVFGRADDCSNFINRRPVGTRVYRSVQRIAGYAASAG
jgi:hypothetical protein